MRFKQPPQDFRACNSASTPDRKHFKMGLFEKLGCLMYYTISNLQGITLAYQQKSIQHTREVINTEDCDINKYKYESQNYKTSFSYFLSVW